MEAFAPLKMGLSRLIFILSGLVNSLALDSIWRANSLARKRGARAKFKLARASRRNNSYIPIIIIAIIVVFVVFVVWRRRRRRRQRQ